MLLALLLLGIVAGLAVALPYGPVGFVIIRRFYLFGMKSGMVSAAGTALSDLFYAVVVGFGLHKIQHFLLSISTYTEFGAAFVLMYLGYNATRTEIALDEYEKEKHPVEDITSTFLLNGLNPTLIFAFALVFTILSKIVHGAPLGIRGTLVFLAGIPTGTLLLWYLIGSGIHYLRRKNRHAAVQRINYVTGLILGAIGIVLLFMTLAKTF